MNTFSGATHIERSVRLPAGNVTLEGDLSLPERAIGVVLFAHGSGSSRFSPRNRYVARVLNDANLGTALIDLLTPDEVATDRRLAHLRFDIGLLADRLIAVTDWMARDADTHRLRLGYFGASTGAAAALVAATQRREMVGAIVSRGGRPDLAGALLSQVDAPTLLVVGGEDPAVLVLNRRAYARLRCEKELALVPGATHLFEEPGTLESAAGLARDWLQRFLAPVRAGTPEHVRASGHAGPFGQ